MASTYNLRPLPREPENQVSTSQGNHREWSRSRHLGDSTIRPPLPGTDHTQRPQMIGAAAFDKRGRKPPLLPPKHDGLKDPHPLASFLLSFDNVINEWWLWEVFGWLMSALALTALVTVLAVCDQKPSPRWQLGITLNAIISICATIAQTTMLVPITQCISQLKWCWFHRRRALSMMQLFDDASRGPWGAIRLLLSTRALLVSSHCTNFKLTVVKPKC